MRGGQEAVFSTIGLTLLGHVGPCSVCVRNGFPPTSLEAERNQCGEKMITGVTGITSSDLRNGFDHMKSYWIPCDHHNHFLILNRMSRLFGRFFFWSKPDLLITYGRIEPWLIEDDNKLLALMFDEAGLAQ
jgi:hypothetical protein